MARAITDGEFIAAWISAPDLQAVADALGMEKRSCTIRAGRLRAAGEDLPAFARGPARKYGAGLKHGSTNTNRAPLADDVSHAVQMVSAARADVAEAKGRLAMAEAALARARTVATPMRHPNASGSGAAMYHVGQQMGQADRSVGKRVDEDGYPIGYYSPRRAGEFAEAWNACESIGDVVRRTESDESAVRSMALKAREYGYTLKAMEGEAKR